MHANRLDQHKHMSSLCAGIFFFIVNKKHVNDKKSSKWLTYKIGSGTQVHIKKMLLIYDWTKQIEKPSYGLLDQNMTFLWEIIDAMSTG